MPAGVRVGVNEGLRRGASGGRNSHPRDRLERYFLLGPGHRWPYLFLPVYRLPQPFPPTRDTARRLYPVTLEQMVAVLIAAVEEPAAGIRIVETQQIRRARLSR